MIVGRPRACARHRRRSVRSPPPCFHSGVHRCGSSARPRLCRAQPEPVGKIRARDDPGLTGCSRGADGPPLTNGCGRYTAPRVPATGGWIPGVPPVPSSWRGPRHCCVDVTQVPRRELLGPTEGPVTPVMQGSAWSSPPCASRPLRVVGTGRVGGPRIRIGWPGIRAGVDVVARLAVVAVRFLDTPSHRRRLVVPTVFSISFV